VRSIGDEQTALAAFVSMSVLAGGNAVAIRFSNRELAPLWGAGLRFALATALLVALMVTLRLTVPRGRALTGAVLYGALAIGGAFALAYYGLVRIHAGLGQTVLALVPAAAEAVRPSKAAPMSSVMHGHLLSPNLFRKLFVRICASRSAVAHSSRRAWPSSVSS